MLRKIIPLVVLSLLSACGSTPAASENSTPRSDVLIPQPLKFTVEGKGRVTLDRVAILSGDDNPQVAYAVESLRKELTGMHGAKVALVGKDAPAPADHLRVALTVGAEKPIPGRFRIAAKEGTIDIAGDDGAGVIYGAYALLQLARNGDLPALFSVEDAPALPLRFYRPAQTKPPGLSEVQRKLMELDWCARWRCNYMITAPTLEDAKTGEKLDLIAECNRRAIVPIGMMKEVKQLIEEPGKTTLDQIRAGAEERLKQGYRGFHVTFDDLTPKVVKGRAEALAKDQIAIIEAIARACEPYKCAGNVFWCPTYYSTVVEKGWYNDNGKQRELYYKTLAASEIVKKSPMYHCHQWKSYAEYLNGLGFNNIVWWYNGVRPFFYIYMPKYCSFPMQPGWWDGTKEVADLPYFVWGWHLLCNELPHKPAAGMPRDVPAAAWEDLRELPKRFRGVYNCTGGSFAEYNHALYGAYSWNPALFDQAAVEAVILDQVFGNGTSGMMRRWSDMYDALAMKVGREKDRSETARAKASADLHEWEAYTRTVDAAIEKTKHPLPDPMIRFYRDCLTRAPANMESKITLAFGQDRPRFVGIILAQADPAEVERIRKASPGLGEDRGVMRIAHVEEGGPADQGGLRKNDFLLALNGKPLPEESSPDTLRKAVAETPRGKAMTFLVLRDGVETTLSITPE